MEEEKEEKFDEEKKKRLLSLKKEFNSVVARLGSEFVDEEVSESITNGLKEKFTEDGIPFTYSYLKAFSEGVEFTIGGMGANQKLMTMTLCVLRKLVEDGTRKVQDKMKEIK